MAIWRLIRNLAKGLAGRCRVLWDVISEKQINSASPTGRITPGFILQSRDVKSTLGNSDRPGTVYYTESIDARDTVLSEIRFIIQSVIKAALEKLIICIRVERLFSPNFRHVPHKITHNAITSHCRLLFTSAAYMRHI